MKDIISIAAECQLELEDIEVVKTKFCDKLLEEFGKMKGEELVPHLDQAVFDMNRKKTIITLSF